MRGHPLSSVFAAALLAALIATPSAPVSAQDSEPTEAQIEEARQNFARGLALSDDGQWREAVAAFRSVIAVRDVPPVMFNLAHALIETNQFSEADELLDRLEADESTTDDLIANSRDLRRRMDRYGGRLTIQVLGIPADEVHVLLDGREIDASRVGQPLRVSQGTHRVTLRAHAADVGRGEQYISRRARRTLSVTVDGTALAAAASRAGAQAEADAARAAADARVQEAAQQAEAAEAAAAAAAEAQAAAERAAARASASATPLRTPTELQDPSAISPEAAAATTADDPSDTDDDLSESPSLARDWRFWTVVAAVAVVGLGVGIGVGVANGGGGGGGQTGFQGNFQPGTVRF